MPEVEIPTYVLKLTHKTYSVEEMARRLRVESIPAIIVRIQKDEIVIDLRSVTKEEEDIVIEKLVDIG